MFGLFRKRILLKEFRSKFLSDKRRCIWKLLRNKRKDGSLLRAVFGRFSGLSKKIDYKKVRTFKTILKYLRD